MADKVRLEVVTPTDVVVDEAVELVVVPGGDGDFGVLPGHAPLMSTLRPGTVTIYERDRALRSVFVSAGFAEVFADRCIVLAEEAVPVTAITAEMVEARLGEARAAEAAARGEADKAEAERALKAAEAMQAARAAGEAAGRRA